jgi:CRP-like cAMP-binding protein
VTTPHFVLSGWACSQRVLHDGRRQIFDFIVPGEGFGFGPFADGHTRQAVVALTAIETVEASGLLEGGRDVSGGGLWQAVRAARAEMGKRQLDHMVRLGRLTAYERVAHFMLEMRRRAGTPEAHSYALPLTQDVIADALGVSVVHLSRLLRQLREARVVEIRGGVAVLHDPQALALAAVLSLPEEPPIPALC